MYIIISLAQDIKANHVIVNKCTDEFTGMYKCVNEVQLICFQVVCPTYMHTLFCPAQLLQSLFHRIGKMKLITV